MSLDAQIAPLGDLLTRVSSERLEADVRRLCSGPRHVQQDHASALAAADWAAGVFASCGLTVGRLDVTAREVTLPAVLAELPGRRSDRAFVVAAHYDTVQGTPGADDNASGVAGVLELARVLAGEELPVTVVLAVVPFEEGDSMQPGDAFFAGARALAQHVCGRWQVIGMISLEMIGFTSPEPDALLDGPQDYLALVGNLEAAALVTRMAEAAALVPVPRVVAAPMEAAGVPVVMPANRDVSGFPVAARSDHAAFWSHGVPAAMATDTANFRNTRYHTPDDTADSLDYAFMAGAVRAVLAGVLAVGADEACP